MEPGQERQMREKDIAILRSFSPSHSNFPQQPVLSVRVPLVTQGSESNVSTQANVMMLSATEKQRNEWRVLATALQESR